MFDQDQLLMPKSPTATELEYMHHLAVSRHHIDMAIASAVNAQKHAAVRGGGPPFYGNVVEQLNVAISMFPPFPKFEVVVDGGCDVIGSDKPF